MFTDEDKERFRDIETYKAFRHNLEDALNVSSSIIVRTVCSSSSYSQSVHSSTLKGSEMQNAARQAFKSSMIERLKKKPWIADHRKLLCQSKE